MLGTHERTLLLDSLRPPAGYRLRRAVGTSFTLDLMALLTAPLAFTFFDAHDEDGAPVTDPVALLQALRGHAEKITLFCQAGAIGVPKPGQNLLAYLESSVIEVQARFDGGIFHPKVWVLNYETDDGPAIYRVLCLSRNLTFARAWDTCLSLEGRLIERHDGYARNEPLAEVLLALPRLAVGGTSTELREELRRMAHEVRRVDFRLPKPFTDFRVHYFGLPGGGGWPFLTGGRSLVVSPYLVGSTVQELVRDHGLETLISRPEAFEDVIRGQGNDALPRKCYVLSPGAELDAQEAEKHEAAPASDESAGDEEQTAAEEAAVAGAAAAEPRAGDEDEVELTGLHAKLYLFENGGNAQLFTGSANATRAAFSQNVEVLVELRGEQKDCGIEALLGPEDDPKLQTIRALLQEYRHPRAIDPTDDQQRELERRVDGLARNLGAVRLKATACAAPRGGDEDERWDLALSGELPAEIAAAAQVKIWPATLSAEAAERIDDGREGPAIAGDPADAANVIATFRGLSFEALTAFFAFEVSLREEAHEARKRFAVTAELVGAPEDRKERLLRSLLKDRDRVLRFLFLILMGEGADPSLIVDKMRDDGAGPHGSFGGLDRATLFEALLRSLSRDPRQIDDVAQLVSDLEKTSEGKNLLPDGFEEIWEPVRMAREALKS